MASVRIDGSFDGKRICVSVDEYLFEIYSIYHSLSSGTQFFSRPLIISDAKTSIYLAICNGKITGSSSARAFILHKIVKPSLIKRLSSDIEYQLDIEDY